MCTDARVYVLHTRPCDVCKRGMETHATCFQTCFRVNAPENSSSSGSKSWRGNDKELLVAVGIACKDGSAPRGWRPINVTSLHATFRPLDSGEKRLIGRSNIWKRVVLSYTMLKSRCAHNGRVHDIGFEKNCLTFLYTSLVILYFHLNF